MREWRQHEFTDDNSGSSNEAAEEFLQKYTAHGYHRKIGVFEI
jgi:hypothetical protein